MKRVFFEGTFEEALKEANDLLLDCQKRDGAFSVTETTQREADGGAGYSEIEDTQGNIVCVYGKRFPSAKNIIFLFPVAEATPKEVTFPFKGVAYDVLLQNFLVVSTFMKPKAEITAEEAITPKGMEKLGSYFYETHFFEPYPGKHLTMELYELTEENLFKLDEVDDELHLVYAPTPYDLEQETEIKIKDVKSYVQGIESLVGKKLSKQQRQTTEWNYTFLSIELYLYFLLYDFLRTESYERLQENLKKYSLFGLPKDWERESDRLKEAHSSTAEEYVLKIYLCPSCRKLLFAPTSLNEIAEYTGTPYDLLLKVGKDEKPIAV